MLRVYWFRHSHTETRKLYRSVLQFQRLLERFGMLFERNSCISLTTFSMYNRQNQLKKKSKLSSSAWSYICTQRKKAKMRRRRLRRCERGVDGRKHRGTDWQSEWKTDQYLNQFGQTPVMWLTGKQAEENKPVSAVQESTGVLNFKERSEQIVKATEVKLGSRSWRENLASWVKVACQALLHPNLHPALKVLAFFQD